VVVNDSLARARAGDEAAFDRLTDAYRKELQAHCYRSLGSVQDAVLHRNLKGRNPASDPFGKKGRAWIAEQGLPVDERLTVDAGLRQLDFVGGERAQIDEVIAQQALGDEDVRGLMTIPGIDVVCAATLAAVIGDVRGFPTSRHLVGYLGLHPTIRPSGNSPARHGRVSKEGSAAARHVLVEVPVLAHARATWQHPRRPMRPYRPRRRT
jgi:transposase